MERCPGHKAVGLHVPRRRLNHARARVKIALFIHQYVHDRRTWKISAPCIFRSCLSKCRGLTTPDQRVIQTVVQPPRSLLTRLSHRSCVGFVLLVALFFLPLHFHPVTTTAQVAKECSCFQGSRSEASPAAQPEDCLPALAAQPVFAESHHWIASLHGITRHSRAPPVTASL